MAEHKYVVFKLDSGLYGIPIERIERILPEPPLIRTADDPELIAGEFQLRGQAVPALDLRTRLDLAPGGRSAQMVVVMTDAGRCGLRVDDLEGILIIADHDIEPDSVSFGPPGDPVLVGTAALGDRVVVLLDIDQVIPRAIRRMVATAA